MPTAQSALPLTIAAQTLLQTSVQLVTYVPKTTTRFNQTHLAKSAKQASTVQEETTGKFTVHLKLRV